MSSLAALMVLVACPVATAHCISEPVRIVSYRAAAACDEALDREIDKMTFTGVRIIGTCNRFDARLLDGRRDIDVSTDVASLTRQATAQKARVGLGYAGKP